MVHIPSASALLALAASAAAQKFNEWPRHNWGGNGLATDGDVDTAEAINITQGAARYALLFNAWIRLSGFYVQSSGDFITDYHVRALIGPVGLPREYRVGEVCGATGNFTFVPLVDPQDGSYVWSDTLFLEVTANRGNASTSVINEIWPVLPGDEIFDPENTSPCPAAAK